ncbi:ATP-binding protein [Hymenobacter elongatus]|uniref:histidine kinase n=1 Tax=Hymenobacter elongatus TaxID=877208 RepID=A0A4Z0PL08_9BACT|nr:ATP-binding protein [Hymenobacter elongatus]TGE15989.1 hypothetical protein E5J99_11205 [Hymenobacter elongatus]
MPVIKKGTASFKPYARLMSILGDQLITDKIVALVEIVKNSYDADATSVTIEFKNWTPQNGEQPPNPKSYIEIRDDGLGMNEDVLLNVYLNPGTPNKLLLKKQNLKTPVMNRTMQGEKGIGRFAINKLGQDISIFSKTPNDPEVQLHVDFADYDNEDEAAPEEYKLLSEISNDYVINEPPVVFTGGPGTLIRINKLKQNWSDDDFASLSASLQKLVAPPDILQQEHNPDTYEVLADFEFKLIVNGEEVEKAETHWSQMLSLAPFQMIGTISEKGVLEYDYLASGPFKKRESKRTINLLNYGDYTFSSKAIKARFEAQEVKEAGGRKLKRLPKQGKIHFSFYVYDMRPKTRLLNSRQKEFLAAHNVFVFRDGIRVYPFGEKDYDWLELSQRRATDKAGDYYNINQIIGFVYITGQENPKLKDTTSRYGMMDVEGAYDDFKTLLIGALNAMKAESDLDIVKEEIIKNQNLKSTEGSLELAHEDLVKRINQVVTDPKEQQQLLESTNKFLQVYGTHNALMKERVETYEDLAGLGLAVEKSSHDAIMVLGRLFRTIDELRRRLEQDGPVTRRIKDLLTEMRDNVDIVYNEMQIIQPLFRISKRTDDIVNVKEIVDKTVRYFRHELRSDIQVTVEVVGKDLLLTTPQGLILQVLINLVDNALYWLKEKGSAPNVQKELLFRVDGNQKTLLVADSGIGISPELADAVFEAFYSRKASGRGLGLYIARELLARMGATISVVYSSPERLLKGANFLIQFETQEA